MDMIEPTCRSCWLSTLSESERERLAAEPITTCVYLCETHQKQWDDLMGGLLRLAPVVFECPPNRMIGYETVVE